ncbi:MAG: M16 family metallopeptidase [Planctomycetota bacterium]|jgi:zinc protease
MARRLSALLALCLLLCKPLSAQDVFPYRFVVDDFPNGLRLVTVPTEFPGIVSIQILVSTGSRNEVEAGKSGFAHFFEHVMFRGSENFTPAQQAAIFKKAGADRNAYTTDDYTNYHTTVPTEELATVLRMEADRFQFLRYSPDLFRTEAMAVLGEYNKNSSNPLNKLLEVMRDTAYSHHTYKHTTMGFLADIEEMPDQYEYSLEFFDRWYRPENTTILVVGDVARENVKELVREYWGAWERGSYRAEIPAEPPQEEPLSCHVEWPSPTQPWVAVAFKGPAFSPKEKDMPTLDVISALAFSENSELFKKLFLRERRVDALFASFPDHTDPYLLTVFARLRDPKDWGIVRDEIIATCESLKTGSVDSTELAAVKSNLKYSFTGTLDSSEAIANALAGYIARTRDPESLNQVYRSYDAVQPADIKAMARKYFVTSSRTIGTLSHDALPRVPGPVDEIENEPDPRAVLMPNSSPLISFRLLFEFGAADDPAGKEGLAYLTANLLTNGASKTRSFEEILDALYPLATGLSVQVDKEMTVLAGTVHRDNLEDFYGIMLEMVTEPAFDESDLARLKNNTISYIDVGLRRGDDEETGKEVMYSSIYQGHPYGHLNAGHIDSIKKIGIEDVRKFYRRYFNSENLVLGISGSYPRNLPSRLRKDLDQLNQDVPGMRRVAISPAPEIDANQLTIVQKSTRATGIHIGFPIEVNRSHPDWVALWLARSYFGEHRSENSYLYQRLREIRGLNYGDYAYIEYFPRGGQQFHPDPNLARKEQIFQVWIRPVPPENGPFAFKAAYYELQKLVAEGISEPVFEATRDYLSKFVNLLVKSQDRRLGYALDSRYYGTAGFDEYVKEQLAALTLEDVNRAIRQHLRSDRLQFVVVTEDAEGFKQAILSTEATPILYQAPPGQEILREDAIIEKLAIPIAPDQIRILSVESVFK